MLAETSSLVELAEKGGPYTIVFFSLVVAAVVITRLVLLPIIRELTPLVTNVRLTVDAITANMMLAKEIIDRGAALTEELDRAKSDERRRRGDHPVAAHPAAEHGVG